jgi:primary-amine oxidase
MSNPSPHPLDPHSAEELTAAVAILTASGNVSAAVRYSCALPVEPDKSFVRNYTTGEVYDRQVRLLGYDVELAGSFDALISIDADRVVEFQTVTRGQSPLSFMDFIKVIQIVKADENWQAAMRKRGIENFDLVQIDPWPAGGFIPPEAKPGARVMRAICFERKFPADNGYAHPIHGVMTYVDIDAEKVIRLDDHGVVPIPPEHGNYDVESSGPMREDLRPIEITQPEGTSFSVEGSLVRWQKWQFRVSLHAIHGPVLHDVGYEDQGRLRPILHRASLSDMVVPYGDSSPMHAWKHVFDASELGLGQFTNSLKLGCDCLGEIHYLDATLLNWNGEPVTVENAICMHEEDYGILWKHFDLHSNRTEVRRSRRLVVSSIHTVGNYEYGLFWYLYLDGTIQFEVKLTGIVGVSAVEPGGGTDTAPLIAPQLASPNHQHLFCARLDFAVDGEANTVYEVDAVTDPIGPSNPQGTAFRSVATPFENEAKAQSRVDPSKSRHWRVANPERKNRLGLPVAYKLLPQGTPTMLAHEDSVHAQRARFAKYNLWVTAYDAAEMSAAGTFTNLHPGLGGLPEYAAKNRPLENTDVVVWHSFGLTHVPRPEDWPVMPVEYCGFSLVPSGFFDKNPALDVPPNSHCKK